MHDSGGVPRARHGSRGRAQGALRRRSAPRPRRSWRRGSDYGLEPINPLDAWGTGNDWEGIFHDCMKALVEDPDTALGRALRRDPRRLFADRRLLRDAAPDPRRDQRSRSSSPPMSPAIPATTSRVRLAQDGVPVLSGVASMLTVVRKAMDRRDRGKRSVRRRPRRRGCARSGAARLETSATLG